MPYNAVHRILHGAHHHQGKLLRTLRCALCSATGPHSPLVGCAGLARPGLGGRPTMGYEARLSLKQAPALALNATLLQAIKLLPLARLDLIQTIQQELMANPMLEEVAVEEDGDTPAEEDAQG